MSDSHPPIIEDVLDQQNKATGSLGCLIWPSIAAVAALALGAWRLSEWENLSGFGRVAAIALTVSGSLLVLPLLALAAFKIFLYRLSRHFMKLGENTIQVAETMFTVHDYRMATDADFHNRNRHYCDDTQKTLAQMGFKFLGDVVDSTVEQTGTTVVIRIMTSSDHGTVVGIYHLVSDLLIDTGQPLHVCDFITEFNNGTDLNTTNTGTVDLSTPRPTKINRKFPRGTPPHMLYQSHFDEMTRMLATQSGLQVVRISTLDEAIESQKRQQAKTEEYRKEIGYIDEGEMQRMAAGIPDTDAQYKQLTISAIEKLKLKRKMEWE